jgi:hypothetical protein
MSARVSRTLAVAALAGLCAGLQAQIARPEVEPNDDKTSALANGAFVMAAGDWLEGTTTGTTGSGDPSPDYFLVRTQAASPGIYRHRLTITSSTAGHTGTIRGLTQANRIINPGTDAVVQTTTTGTNPPRFNQWYGFGKQEEIFYRISGSAATTAPYMVTLTTEPVVPIEIGTYQPGTITVARAAGNSSDTDFWIYDDQLNAIPGYGNDDPNTVTRDFQPGTYYIAWTNYNFANDQPAPPDDTFGSGIVLDYPNAAANSNTTLITNLGVRMTDSTGQYDVPLSKTEPFEILWLRFVVTGTPPVQGACCLPSGACTEATQFICTSQGGIYQGDEVLCSAVVCRQPGACCLTNLTCSVQQESTCLAQGGQYQGDGTDCGTINCPVPPGVFVETGDAGDLPSTAMVVSNAAGAPDPLLAINGQKNAANDVDLFQIYICDPFSFSAATLGGANWDTMLWLFDEAGNGIVANDDSSSTLQSRITGELVPAAGHYYIGISRYHRRPLADPYGAIWTSYGNWGPNGPGAAYAVTSWENTTAIPTNPEYRIAFTGTCFVQTTPACYANCDGSTTPPILNVEDFSCFINEFAAAQALPPAQQLTHYANCDQSTTAPVLNVEDFSCFINKFAQGCN